MLAVLGFFAFRPRKGWLRKKGAIAAGGAALLSGGSDVEGGGAKGKAPSSGGEPPAEVLDSFLTQSYCFGQSPAASQLGSAPGGTASGGMGISGAAVAGAAVAGAGVAAAGLAAATRSHGTGSSDAGSGGTRDLAVPVTGTDSDPLLSYISSYVASHPTTQTGGPHPPAFGSREAAPISPAPSAAVHSGGSNPSQGGGSDSSGLFHTEWEVQWGDLTIEGLIGRGSFGQVYLAQWQMTKASAAALCWPACKVFAAACGACGWHLTLAACLLARLCAYCRWLSRCSLHGARTWAAPATWSFPKARCASCTR